MYLYREGEGESVAVGDTDSRLVVPAVGVHGGFCMMHQVLAPGLVSPAHRHEHEDQVAYVLEGSVGFWVEGCDEIVGNCGAVVTRPRGRLHALWNTSGRPARILEITTPAEPFETWIRGLTALTRAGTAAEGEVRGLAAEYGITFAGPGEEDPSRRRGHTHHAAFWREGSR